MHARWLPKKLTVLDQSLAKIENGKRSFRSPLLLCLLFLMFRFDVPLSNNDSAVQLRTTCASAEPSTRIRRRCCRRLRARWQRVAVAGEETGEVATRSRRALKARDVFTHTHTEVRFHGFLAHVVDLLDLSRTPSIRIACQASRTRIARKPESEESTLAPLPC